MPEGAATTQTGWEVYPQALGHTVRLAAERTGVPVLVTENGIATDDDDLRIAYTSAALEGLAGCVDDGIDVRGYLHWTLLDNFEWMSGFAMTFGLIAVDRGSFAAHGQAIGPVARRGGATQPAGHMNDVEGIRWGIAGPGAIATRFAEGMRSVAGGTVVAVGSRSAERAEAFARRFDIARSYGSYEELAADADVDAVYVATPRSRHAADTLLFLGAGKHVLCEKPFTLNATQTSEVVRAAASRTAS